MHIWVEAGGKPLAFFVTGGQRHEAAFFERLMESGPAVGPGRVVGDKGYSHDRIRRYLGERGVGAVIPYRSDQTASGTFAQAAYRCRNRVERLTNRLKQLRRIATRHEKRAANYLAMLTIAAVVLWL